MILYDADIIKAAVVHDNLLLYFLDILMIQNTTSYAALVGLTKKYSIPTLIFALF